jgi:hypothetical protein
LFLLLLGLSACRHPEASGFPSPPEHPILRGWRAVAAREGIPDETTRLVIALMAPQLRRHAVAEAPPIAARYEESLTRFVRQNKFALIDRDWAAGAASWMVYCILEAWRRDDRAHRPEEILASYGGAIDDLERSLADRWLARAGSPDDALRRSVEREAKRAGERLKARMKALQEDALCPAVKAPLTARQREALLRRYRRKASEEARPPDALSLVALRDREAYLARAIEADADNAAGYLFYLAIRDPLATNPYWGPVACSCRDQAGPWPLWVTLAPDRVEAVPPGRGRGQSREP